MKVTTQDEQTFVGETPESIVSQMKRTDWSAPPKKAEYMREVAERVEMMTGQKARSDNASVFLLDLERAQFLTIEELTPEQAQAFTALATEERRAQPRDESPDDDGKHTDHTPSW
jgi:hypothetical protein